MHVSNYLLLISVAAGLLLFSCSEQDQPVDAKAAQTGSTPADPIQLDANSSTDQGTSTTIVSDPNPAHGEPGHRCEIPVGASLSSAPAPGAADPASAVINTSPVIGGPTATDVVTPAGMNPPHGQPGHDCAVAVGSPLPK